MTQIILTDKQYAVDALAKYFFKPQLVLCQHENGQLAYIDERNIPEDWHYVPILKS